MAFEMEVFLEHKLILMGAEHQCKCFYDYFLVFCGVEVEAYFFLEGQAADKPFWQKRRVNAELFDYKKIFRNGYRVILCTDNITERNAYDDRLYKSGLPFAELYIDALLLRQYAWKSRGLPILGRKVWIFGAGKNGAVFYRQYKDIFSIQGFISNFEHEKEYMGLPVLRPAKPGADWDAYIIVCSDSYEQITGQLKSLGYQWLEQFCLPQFIPKRLFAAIGTCQVRLVAELLLENQAFCRQFNSLIFFDNADFPAGFSDRMRMELYGPLADVVFYQVKGFDRDNQINYEYLMETHYKRAKKIRIPLYYFMGQFMQAGIETNPYTIFFENNTNPWFRGDRIINHLIEEGYGDEEIISKIMDEAFWTEEEILENYRRALNKIKILDRFSDIRIADFVEQNYKLIPIFRDGTHLSMELGIFMGNEICRILNVAKLEKEDEIKRGLYEGGKSYFPVYPSVARSLGLAFGGAGARFPCWNPNREILEYIDFTEYVKRYIKYVRCVIGIRERYGCSFP